MASRVRAVLVVVGIVAGVLTGYEFLVGFPRFIDGKWVRRVTVWHVYTFTPIPYQRGTIYYAYTRSDGTEARHGPVRMLHANGRVSDAGAYQRGEMHGTWTRWDHRGHKTNENFWWRGRQRGWAIYEAGQVQYYNEQIYEADQLVAWKRYENGRWFLAVPVGVEPRFRIDPVTGALAR